MCIELGSSIKAHVKTPDLNDADSPYLWNLGTLTCTIDSTYFPRNCFVATGAMSSPIIDYEFNGRTVSNPGGNLRTTLPEDAQIVDGPGAFGGRNLPKGVKLASKPIQVDISSVPIPDATRFLARVFFKLDQSFNNQRAPQTLVESRRLPFSIQLQGQPNSSVKLICSVTSVAGTRTTQITSVSDYDVIPGTWTSVALLFELDTVGLHFQGRVMSCHGFGTNGTVVVNTAEKFLYIGGESNTSRFQGSIALAVVELGLNGQSEDILTQHRTTVLWYTTTAVENHRKKYDVGQPTEPLRFSEPATTWIQHYQNGAVLYSPASSSACVIFGLIWDRYRLLDAGTKGLLGILASDELVSRQEVGRKSLFQGGGIYWSPATPALEVYGPIYLHYETTGEAAEWGFPLRAMQMVNGGTKQHFEKGIIFHKNEAPAAQGIRGNIMELYNSTGGVDRWGFPVSPQESLHNIKNPFITTGPSFERLVDFQEFERGSAYWSADSGAHFIYGHIREEWLAKGGPHSSLGLPNTEEMDIPGAPGARMNGFDLGVITWFGARNLMWTITPFKLFLGVIKTQESEGLFGGRNNMYANFNLKNGNNVLIGRRFPASGEFEAGNIANINEKLPTIIAPKPFETYSFTLDVWDDDDAFLGGDDHLGTWTKTLNAANAWGFKDNMGLLSSGSIDKLADTTAALHPEVDLKSLSQAEKFWGITNTGTDYIDYKTYAEAFRDVDPEPEGWDIIDWTEKLFWELAVKGVAKNGRCFGLTVEAINAQIGSSIFSQPINRFNWDAIQHVINVKQCYQLGSTSCFFFVGAFLSGTWSDPLKVYDLTKQAFESSNWPIISISQGRDFSGKAHAILPYSFEPSQDPSKMHKIHMQDSNVPGGGFRDLEVNFINNSFTYVGGAGADVPYHGGTAHGGRFFYTPWHVVSTRPRTPLAEAAFFLATAILVIIGDDSATVSIKGRDGEDLDAHGPDATEKLRSGIPANNYFAKHPVMAGSPEDGKILLTRGHQGLTLPPAPVLNAEQRRILSFPGVQPRNWEPQISTRVPKTWFSHEMRGRVSNGNHSHFVKAGSSHIYTSCPIDTDEKTTLQGRDLQSSTAEVSWQLDRPKTTAEFTVMHRKGHERNGVMMKFDLALSSAGTLLATTRPGLTAVVFNPGTSKPTKAVLTITVAKDGKASSTSYDLIQLTGINGQLSNAVRIKFTPGSMGDKVAMARLNWLGQIESGSRPVVTGQAIVVNADIPEFAPRIIPH